VNILAPVPFDRAVERLRGKAPVATALGSAAWADTPLAIRERSIWSAHVNSARAISAIQTKIGEALDVYAGPGRSTMDRSKFVSEMRSIMREEGLDTGGRGLTNPASRRRLELIYNFQTEDAMSYGRWKSDQDPDALDAYPAQEFLRVESRRVPRNDWPDRWKAAGGRLFGGRMIALKTDPIWEALSRFGQPWPPFDYGSGMGVVAIDADEAIALGLIDEGELLTPSLPEFNARLEASASDLDPDIVQGLQADFGDQLVARDGRLQWEGDRLVKLFTGSIDGSVPQKWTVALGQVPPSVLQVAPAGYLQPGDALTVKPDDLRHAIGRHGRPDVVPGKIGEADASQRPLEAHELAWIPHVWREPDSIGVGEDGALIFRKHLADLMEIVFDRRDGSRTWRPASIRVKR
jgi:hypothetical protein